MSVFSSPSPAELEISREEPAVPLIQLSALYSIFAGAAATALYLIREPLGGPSGTVFLCYWLQSSGLMGAATIGAASVAGTDRYLIWFLAVLGISLCVGAFPSLVWLGITPPAAITAIVIIKSLKASAGHALLAALAILGILLLSSSYFLQVNAMIDSVFLPEQILTGAAYPDTLFHTALSEMLVWYHRLASALDGFVPIRYHIFSHLWFGLVAKASGINIVNGYYVGMQVLALPLLLFGLSFATCAFFSSSRTSASAPLLIAVPIALLFVIECFDYASYLDSESYAVGLLLLLIGIPFLRSIAKPESYGIGRVFLSLIYALLLSAAKISIGAVWTLPLLYLLVRNRKTTAGAYGVGAVLLAVQGFLVFTYLLPDDNVATTSFEPLAFIRSYPVVAAANLVPICIAAIFHIRQIQRQTGDSWDEIVVLMLLISVLPALFLQIEGGSAYYFLNIGTWLATASLSGRLISRFGPYNDVPMLGLATLIIVAGAVLNPAKTTAYERLKSQRDGLFERLNPADSRLFHGSGLFDREALKALATDSGQSIGARIGKLLERVNAKAGSRSLVTVTPGFHAFWSLTSQCTAAPFLIPSFFGLPMLKGLPPARENCALDVYYGYRFYGSKSHAENLDETTLCKLTREKGFANLIIIESENNIRQIQCANDLHARGLN